MDEQSGNDVAPVDSLLTLDNLLLAHIGSFLDIQSVLTVRLACKRLAGAMMLPELWRSKYLKELEDARVRRNLPPVKDESLTDWLSVYGLWRAMQTLERAEWVSVQCDERDVNPRTRFEGHAVCLWQERYAVIALGFGPRGIEHGVRVIDLQTSRWLKMDEPDPPQSRPTYGHTLTPLPDGRLLLYGGCTMGGYYGAVDRALALTIDVNEDKAKATWEELHLGPGGIGSTSYHFAGPLPNDPSKLLFFGGLADEPINTVAVLDANVLAWERITQAAPDASQPTPRYGFAAGIVDNEFWVIGGCDGGDIRRDGRDQRDVWSLDLFVLLEQGQVSWYQVSPEVPEATFGRETAHVVVGSKILALGGSTGHMLQDTTTNALYWFDTEEHDFGRVRMHAADPAAIPRPHLSSEAILYKNYLVVFGGWTLEGLLRGPFFANLRVTKDRGTQERESETESNPVTSAQQLTWSLLAAMLRGSA